MKSTFQNGKFGEMYKYSRIACSLIAALAFRNSSPAGMDGIPPLLASRSATRTEKLRRVPPRSRLREAKASLRSMGMSELRFKVYLVEHKDRAPGLSRSQHIEEESKYDIRDI